MTANQAGVLMRWTVWFFFVAMLGACVPFNQGIDDNLSDQSMVCKDGIKYLPFTNYRDQAYTSEGRPETCPRVL